MQLQQTVKSFIRQGEQSGYVAECLKISVVTQGDTLDEVVQNLREAISLHLEDEDPAIRSISLFLRVNNKAS